MTSQSLRLLLGISWATLQSRAFDLDAPLLDPAQCMVQFIQTDHKIHTRAQANDDGGLTVGISSDNTTASVATTRSNNLTQPSRVHGVEDVLVLSGARSRQNPGSDVGDRLQEILRENPDLVKRFGKPRVRPVHDGPFDVSKIVDQMGAFNMTEVPANSGLVFLVICFIYVLLCACYEYRQLRAADKTMLAENDKSDAARNDEWDLIKLVSVNLVVLAHVAGFMCDAAATAKIMFIFLPIAMPCLIAISGIFSRSVHMKSLISTVIGFPWALFAFAILVYVVTLFTPGRPCLQFGRSGVEWYLQCMIVWRLVCGPLFSFARKLGLPSILPMLAVWLASYLIWFGIELQDLPPIEIEMEFLGFVKLRSDIAPPEVLRALQYTWRPMVAWLPTFAFGLLLSPGEWGDILFNDRRVTWAAYLVLVLYYVLLTQWPAFDNWWDVGCHSSGSCSYTWWPTSLLTSGINVKTFILFVRINLMRLVTMTAWLAVIGSWVVPLKEYVPRTASILFACGTRTIYAYLLHWALFCIPGTRTTFGTDFLVPLGFPQAGDATWALLATLFLNIMVSGIVTLALSSQFTELVFGFLVKTPMWIFDYLGLFGKALSCDPASQKKSWEKH